MREVHISPLVVVGRILAVIGMALSVSLGIFLLLGGLWTVGAIILLAFFPFFGLLFSVEWLATRRL